MLMRSTGAGKGARLADVHAHVFIECTGQTVCACSSIARWTPVEPWERLRLTPCSSPPPFTPLDPQHRNKLGKYDTKLRSDPQQNRNTGATEAQHARRKRGIESRGKFRAEGRSRPSNPPGSPQK